MLCFQDPVTYSMARSDVSSLYFDVNNMTGQITLNASLLTTATSMFRVSGPVMLSLVMTGAGSSVTL